MNERIKENLDEAKEIIDELNSMYIGYIDDVNEVDIYEVDPPVGFIAKNQRVQFRSALKKLKKAVQNIYTTDISTRKEIANYMSTLDNLIEASKEVKADYPALYDFYLNHFLPIAEEVISFCKYNDSPIIQRDLSKEKSTI